MDKKILQAVKKYKQLALSLADFDAENRLGEEIDPDIQAALLALYYAKTLDDRLEMSAELLSEHSDEQTVIALMEAADSIDDASKSALSRIEQYANDMPEFAAQIATVSISSAPDGLFGNLLRLYKCESIIETVYRYASAHSYTSTPEEFVYKHMDVDINELQEIRRVLLDDIGGQLGNEM